MPSLQTRRLLIVLVLLGVIFSCAGVVLYITAPTFRDLEPRIGWVRGLLIAAWLILVPIFIYMIRLRSRARRGQRRRLQERAAELDQQLSSLATPEGIRAVGGETETAGQDERKA
jgi:type VI protein secretion system component VasK